MQTVNRAKLIFRAHVTDLLDKTENRQKIRQFQLEEMREDIRSVKSFVARAIADLKLIERQIDENEAATEKWEQRAAFAVQKGEEDLARRALARKHEHVKRAQHYREQLETQRETIETLKASLKTLESKLETMRYTSTKLLVREGLLTSTPTRRTTPAVDLITDTSAVDAYERIVEKVQDMEAQAEAFAELTQGDELERKFDELETKDDVEKDFIALKAKINAESPE